jgi:hypothetical protein
MQRRTHHGMTNEDRRLLQLWFDIHEWRDRYVELHGELPKFADRCDGEFDSRDNDRCLDIMPSHFDALFEPPEEVENE